MKFKIKNTIILPIIALFISVSVGIAIIAYKVNVKSLERIQTEKENEKSDSIRFTINAIIEKHSSDAVYICKGNHLSFVLDKAPIEEMSFEEERIEEKATPLQTQPETPAPVVEFLTTDQEEELHTFDILDADELEDFETYLLRLRSLILLMENSSLETSDIDELCHSFDEMASILSISNDTYVLSNALRELSDAISHNQEHFKESSMQLFDFVNAFMNDLIFWKTKIFYDGAPSVDFLNDSITTNVNMLNALLQPEAETTEDLGDIFDF